VFRQIIKSAVSLVVPPTGDPTDLIIPPSGIGAVFGIWTDMISYPSLEETYRRY